ncbi:hypothetical protein ATANTOWER_026098 [Ataeniobius toweri]|uniref:Uncharacterized protein n=1 Tax=Ataeniobius toweri TaxID=208326 RepID=A0ABU7AIK7_9TELE|nr:hypothetical protein [Ataeniobius toweri]
MNKFLTCNHFGNTTVPPAHMETQKDQRSTWTDSSSFHLLGPLDVTQLSGGFLSLRLLYGWNWTRCSVAKRASGCDGIAVKQKVCGFQYSNKKKGKLSIFSKVVASPFWIPTRTADFFRYPVSRWCINLH